MIRNIRVCRFAGGLLALFFVLVLTHTTLAVAPMPGTLEKWKAEGTLEKNLAILKAFRDAGGDAPAENPPFSRERMAAKMAYDPNAVETLNVIVILVDFADNPATVGDSAKFDSMLFSVKGDPDQNPTGSMTDYYFENSYGKLFIKGDVTHWLRMPNPYSYYVGTDMGLGIGGRWLAYAAAFAADSFVNFTKYDNDGDGYVDGIVVVHAGKGAEEGGDSNAIWSHRGGLSTSLVCDGKLVNDYTMNPEKFLGAMVPIGVFCHEYGHILALPDLYDTDYTPSTSDGLGSWSLMASGNYNGSGKLPAHFDPWSKLQLGFLDFTTDLMEVTSNLYQAPVPAVEYNPLVYRILSQPSGATEYWLVENRQRVGFDLGLPASGLLIYHIDGAVTNNNNYLRYKVALEQADGRNDLALTAAGADAGDPWPGNTVNRNFHDMSNPNAHDNATNSPTEVGVWRITNSDSVMYADLDVSYSRPYLSFFNYDSVRFMDTVGSADGDGLVEAGETADFYCRIRNFMRIAYGWQFSLTCDDPDVQISGSPAVQTSILTPVLDQGVLSNVPIRITLSPTARTKIVSFTMIIQADSVFQSLDRRYVDTFFFEAELGAPRILVVDDDEGFSFDTLYTNALHNLRIPHRVWHKQAQGSPAASELNKYTTVLWLTGDTLNGGALNPLDIAALKTFLDAGNNLAFASIKGPRQLDSLDPTFISNYMHARWDTGGTLIPYFRGVTGHPLGDTFAFRFSTAYYVGGLLNPVNGGITAFNVTNVTRTQNLGSCGVTYNGAYKTFIMTWGAEFISDNWAGDPWATKQTFIDQILKFFGESVVTDVAHSDEKGLPASFVLNQNYPNPFNPSTEISYMLNPVSSTTGKPAAVNLAIYNLLGQKVATLVDAVQSPGTYSVSWDGSNQAGRKVASGVYFYRLTRGAESTTKKMLLLK